jgi:hypothetical protein
MLRERERRRRRRRNGCFAKIEKRSIPRVQERGRVKKLANIISQRWWRRRVWISSSNNSHATCCCCCMRRSAFCAFHIWRFHIPKIL